MRPAVAVDGPALRSYSILVWRLSSALRCQPGGIICYAAKTLQSRSLC